ncbi:unnamed protein product [Camellia sinensis]
MIALFNAGYRVIALDSRGYELSDLPPVPKNASYADIINNLFAILDSLCIPKDNHLVGGDAAPPLLGQKLEGNAKVPLERKTTLTKDALSDVTMVRFLEQYAAQVEYVPGEKQLEFHHQEFICGGNSDQLNNSMVFLVAKDFGTRTGFFFALLYPERVSGIITMGVPFVPPSPFEFGKNLPEGFYMSRWKEPGRAEADFGRFDAKTVVRNIYILFSKSEIPIAAENQEMMDLVEPSTSLPTWFTEEDLEAYEALYKKSGFLTALRIPYRSVEEEFMKVEAPTLLIMGEKDYFLKFPGVEDYIRSGQVKVFVPDLEITYLPEGSHFVQEQLPNEVNQIVLTFLKKHSC